MKKKFFVCLAVIITLAFGVVACGSALEQVKNVKVENTDIATGSVTWSKVEGAYSYRVNLAGKDKYFNTLSAPLSSWELVAGTEYSVKVRAQTKDNKVGEDSQTVKFTATETIVHPPEDGEVTAPTLTREGKVISWGEVENAGSYDIEVLSSKDISLYTRVDDSALSFDLSIIGEENIQADGTYKIKVTAKNATKSNSATIDYQVPKLNTPVLEAELLTLSWNEVTGASKYLVTVGTSAAVEIEETTYTAQLPSGSLSVAVSVTAVSADKFLTRNSDAATLTVSDKVLEKFAVTVTENAGVSYVITGAQDLTQVAEGTVLTITATVKDGYSNSTITVNGQAFTSGNTVTVNAAMAIVFSAQLNEYDITYGGLSVDDSNNADNPVKFSITTDTITLKDPTTTTSGKYFKAWRNGNTDVTVIPTGSKNNIMLTAIWEYKVTLPSSLKGAVLTVKQNGNVIGDRVEGGSIISVTATLNIGYKDLVIKVNGTGVSSGQNHTVNSATVITISVTPIEYRIIYENIKEGDTNPNSATTYNIESAAISFIDAASGAGREFVRWECGGSPISEIPTGSYGDKTITAVWNQKHTVTVIGHKGVEYTVTGADDLGQVADGTVLTITAMVKAGYTDVAITVNGVSKASGYKLTVNETVTIKFGATAIEYTITYKEAFNNSNNPATYTIEDNIILSAPTHNTDGVLFDCWKNGATVITEIPVGSTGNIELTATWKLGNTSNAQLNTTTGILSWDKVTGAVSYDLTVNEKTIRIDSRDYNFIVNNDKFVLKDINEIIIKAIRPNVTGAAVTFSINKPATPIKLVNVIVDDKIVNGEIQFSRNEYAKKFSIMAGAQEILKTGNVVFNISEITNKTGVITITFKAVGDGTFYADSDSVTLLLNLDVKKFTITAPSELRFTSSNGTISWATDNAVSKYIVNLFGGGSKDVINSAMPSFTITDKAVLGIIAVPTNEDYANSEATTNIPYYAKNGTSAVTAFEIDGIYSFIAMQKYMGDAKYYFKQTADIALTAPITMGTAELKFEGKYDGAFDGGKRAIIGVAAASGAFGVIGANGEIKNIQITANINEPTISNVGAVASENNGKIDGAVIFAGSTIIGKDTVGGIVGLNYGTIMNSVNNAAVTGADQVGGITGWNNNFEDSKATIIKSDNNGIITGKTQVGGIAGVSSGYIAGDIKYAGDITTIVAFSFNAGKIIANGTKELDGMTGTFAGGIAGSNYGEINGMKNRGEIGAEADKTKGYSGGIAGRNKGKIDYCVNTADGAVYSSGIATGGIVGINDVSSISNCKNFAEISGADEAGGIAGQHLGGEAYKILNCGNEGAVNGANKIGGIVGYNRANVTVSYNTGAITGTGLMVGGIVGHNDNMNFTKGAVYTVYNTGTVTGPATNGRTGGIAGQNRNNDADNSPSAWVANCYNSGMTNGGGISGWGGAGGQKDAHMLTGTGYANGDGDGGSILNDAVELKTLNNSWFKDVTEFAADDTANPINGGYAIFTWQKNYPAI